jgi:hypothetical protein
MRKSPFSPFSMRLEPELRARLQDRADREHRSLTNLVDLILRQAVGLLDAPEEPARSAKRRRKTG